MGLPRKPKNLLLGKFVFAEIFDDAAPHQFCEETDPIMIHRILIAGEHVYDLGTDESNCKEIAKNCRKLAKWLMKAADWFETLNQVGDRCHVRRRSNN